MTILISTPKKQNSPNKNNIKGHNTGMNLWNLLHIKRLSIFQAPGRKIINS